MIQHRRPTIVPQTQTPHLGLRLLQAVDLVIVPRKPDNPEPSNPPGTRTHDIVHGFLPAPFERFATATACRCLMPKTSWMISPRSRRKSPFGSMQMPL